MRILILGGDGMLGHRLLIHLRQRHDVCVTVHRQLMDYTGFGLFDNRNTLDGIDLCKPEFIEQAIDHFRPAAIINAAGIVKQRAESKESIACIEVNALLPHRLALLCEKHGIRLIHMSTDCVFSGKHGNYHESDFPDADDLYGRSKLLGEVSRAPCLTLRTSIIGRELLRKTGLLEWFLAQQGRIRGFRNAIFSGFTTHEMARIIERVLTHFPEATGMYHVSSTPINKYELLRLIKNKFDRTIDITADDTFSCDRSLNSSRFQTEFAYTPPTWEFMIDELTAATMELQRNDTTQ